MFSTKLQFNMSNKMDNSLIYLSVGEMPTPQNVVFSQVFENAGVFSNKSTFTNVSVISVIPFLSFIKNFISSKKSPLLKEVFESQEKYQTKARAWTEMSDYLYLKDNLK